MDERCEFSDLYVDQCAHCRNIVDPEVEALQDEKDFYSTLAERFPRGREQR